MTGWHLGPLCPFDTESTGVDVETDRIVSATVATIHPGPPTSDVVRRDVASLDELSNREAAQVLARVQAFARQQEPPAGASS